jgi:hypothetical protein
VPEPPELTLIRAGVAVLSVDSRVLPALAEELLAKGFESPGMVALAILNSQAFDAREARDRAGETLGEMGLQEMAPIDAADYIAALLSARLEAGSLSPRQLTKAAAGLVVEVGYDAGDELMSLYTHDDYWGQGWAPPDAVIEAHVRETADILVRRFPELRGSGARERLVVGLPHS